MPDGASITLPANMERSQCWEFNKEMLAFAAGYSRVYGGGGFIDFHIHADRVGTRLYLDQGGNFQNFANAPLTVKQDAIGILHKGPAFTAEELVRRMDAVVQLKIAAGEVETNFVVDCSPDIDGRAFRAALALREKYAREITINVGAYPIFGLKSWDSDRHLHLKELAPRAQFIMGLPERDARLTSQIGFEGHIGLLYELAHEHQIPLHVHVDQTNTPGETGTQRLIASIRTLSGMIPPEEQPRVWAVHMLIGGKEDREIYDILRQVKELNIGLVCCPHAAGSMRQMRNIQAPLHSSIAPVRECLVMGIPVRFGTDNTDDHLMPLPKLPLLVREVDTLTTLLRYYELGVLYKLARGEKPNSTDLASVAASLADDYKAYGLPNPWAQFSH